MKTSLSIFGTYIKPPVVIVFIFLFTISVQHSVTQDFSLSGKSRVVIDPGNKQNITGNVQIAIAWGEQLTAPHDLTRGVIHLKDAMNRWTKIQTSIHKNLLLSTGTLLRMPFIFVTSRDAFQLTETEKKNITEFFKNGGFMVVDNADPRLEQSKSGASLKQMLRDTIPNARFLPIPKNHPLYHCFFDFTDGPPNGAEIGRFGSVLSKQRLYLEGVWYRGRLVAVYSDKGYIIKWNDNSNNEPQLKIGVNMIVFALTQEGGIADKF